MTTAELAPHLQCSKKALRDWLRANYRQHDPYARWNLTAPMVLRAVQHFGLIGWRRP